ncbi:putative vacuolar protein-sorting protein, partial [Hamiltosporidium tvaerminnensis]
MFKSIATALLNRVLGNYIENLNRKQLKIGIWNGKVEMSNIILKLPPTLSSTYFTLIKGTIQSLSLTIPWSNISKNFSFLEITNIQITLLTGITDPYKIKKYIIEALTEKIIKSISEGISEGSRYDNNNRGTSSRDTNNNNRIDTNNNNRIDTNNTFITRIVAKILNNLQIIIKEIEIRVITLEGHIFKFKIDLIKMKSCNSKWDMIEGVSDRDMMEGIRGVSDRGSGVEGVSDSTNEQHPVSDSINEQHPVGDSTNEQHPVSDSTSQHLVNNDTNTQHPVNNSTSQHPVNNSTSQHPVNNSTNEHHPVNNSINEQHPVNNSTSQHPVNNSTSQHPVNNNTTHHPINNNTTHHPVNNDTTHHPVNNNTTHHPINNNTFKIIHVKGFSININNYLLFDLQIITIKCTINNKNLLFKTDIEIPNINTELTIDSYKKVIEFIHTILVEKNKNENLMIKSINSKILEIEEFIRKGGVMDKGMLEGVNDNSSPIEGVNYKDSVIGGVNNSTNEQHPLYISTDVQHPLYISTNEQHPVNNQTNTLHPVNTSTPNINTHIWNLIYQIYFEKYKINTFDRNDTLNILKENEKYCDLYRKKINKKIKKEEEIELNEFENKNLIKKIINLRNEVLNEKTPKKSFFSYFWNKKVSKEDKKEIYKAIEYTDSKGSIVGEVDSKDSDRNTLGSIDSVNALSSIDTNTNNNNLTLPTSPYLDSDSLEYVDALEPSDETYKKLTREVDNKEVGSREIGSKEIGRREVDNKEIGSREKDSKQSISKKYVCNFLVKNFNFNFKVNENIKYSISIENIESFISKEGRSIDLSLSVYNFNIFYKKYDKTYKILRNKRGVEDSTSKEGGVSDRGSKEEGVSDRGSKEKGVSNRGSKEEGVSECSSKEGGVSDSTNEQRGVSNSTSKQQGVSNTTINYNPLNNNTTNFCNVIYIKEKNTLNIFINEMKILNLKKIFFLFDKLKNNKINEIIRLLSIKDILEGDSGGGVNNSVDRGVSDKDNKQQGVNKSSMYFGGVNDKGSKQQGVNKSSKEEGVNDKDSKQHGVNDKDSKEEGVNNRDNKEEGVNDKDSKQQGVNDKDSKQQGVNDKDSKEEGVNASTNNYHPLNNNTNNYHPLNNNSTNYHPLNTNTYNQHPFNNNLTIVLNIRKPKISISKYVLREMGFILINQSINIKCKEIILTSVICMKNKFNLQVKDLEIFIFKNRIKEYIVNKIPIEITGSIVDTVIGCYDIGKGEGSGVEGVNDKGSVLEGVKDTGSMEGGVSDRGSKQQGVKDTGSMEGGVSDRGSKQQGVSDSSVLEGVNDSTSKQEGFNYTTDVQDPVNNTTNQQHPFNNLPNQQ